MKKSNSDSGRKVKAWCIWIPDEERIGILGIPNASYSIFAAKELAQVTYGLNGKGEIVECEIHILPAKGNTKKK